MWLHWAQEVSVGMNTKRNGRTVEFLAVHYVVISNDVVEWKFISIFIVIKSSVCILMVPVVSVWWCMFFSVL